MKNIVLKIEEGVDPRDVHCTTYQMRNCFKQFADGVAGALDAYCYFEHAFVAERISNGDAVLDVCCGKGLMIPFLRYGAKTPKAYVGVDISSANAVFARGKDPRRPTSDKTNWGFEVHFVESDVATMTDPVRQVHPKPFDWIVYTSAIEHMQPAAQQASLKCARELSQPGTALYLTCPVTTDAGRTGYDTQYAAHVYEPTEEELRAWLSASDWKIRKRIGVLTKVSSIRERLTGSQLKGAEYLLGVMPRLQALTTIPILYPACTDEIALLCEAI